MNIIVFSSSPNKDGLTAACAAAAVEGVHQAGGQAEEVRLNDRQVGICLLYTSPSPRDRTRSRMPSSA